MFNVIISHRNGLMKTSAEFPPTWVQFEEKHVENNDGQEEFLQNGRLGSSPQAFSVKRPEHGFNFTE